MLALKFLRPNKNCVQCAFYSAPARAFQEIKIPVPWGHIAGKWWHPSERRPILALHGWQDNCGTFDRLIPMLNPTVGFLAIDLPGHGYSSRLPPGLFYHNMNYPILIKTIANHFKWDKVSLMGHSLGAISCFLYTMIFPDSVDFLVCIDGVKPLHMKNNAPRMAIGLEEFLRYNELGSSPEEPPSYPMEVLEKKVAASNGNSISLEHCHHIVARNTAPSKTDPKKYYFTRDPRLKSRLILNWPQNDLLEGAKTIRAPVVITKFKDSGYFEDKKNFYELLDVLQKSSRDAQIHYVEGNHHTHLNHPERVSGIINDFIAKHDSEERIKGGFKN